MIMITPIHFECVNVAVNDNLTKIQQNQRQGNRKSYDSDKIGHTSRRFLKFVWDEARTRSYYWWYFEGINDFQFPLIVVCLYTSVVDSCLFLWFLLSGECCWALAIVTMITIRNDWWHDDRWLINWWWWLSDPHSVVVVPALSSHTQKYTREKKKHSPVCTFPDW